MITIVRATQEHAELMAPIMRLEDSTEVLAMGLSPLKALTYSLEHSWTAETALIDGQPVAMWGACAVTLAGERGFMWMLGTEQVPRNVRSLLRVSRHFVSYVQRIFPILECMVDMRYEKAFRWIMWMGFKHVGNVDMNGVNFAFCRKEADSGNRA